MLKFTIRREDLLRSKLLDPAWYVAKIKKPWKEPTKKGDSDNYIVDFTITTGPSQKDGINPVGLSVRRYFNEKGSGYAKTFFEALGVKFDLAKEAFEVDFEAAEGREVQVYVSNRLDDSGVMRNSVEDFRPI